MANERLIHDVAVATSKHILEVISPCLREEEQRDAFQEIYDRVKAGIQVFDLQQARLAERLDPGSN